MTYVPEIPSPFLLVNHCRKKAGKQAISAPTEKEVNERVYIGVLIERRNTFTPFDAISPSIPAYSGLSYMTEASERAQTGYP